MIVTKSEDKPNRNPNEQPVKEDDHGPDALRYLVLHLKYGVQKDAKIPESSLLKKLNDYGM